MRDALVIVDMQLDFVNLNNPYEMDVCDAFDDYLQTEEAKNIYTILTQDVHGCDFYKTRESIMFKEHCVDENGYSIMGSIQRGLKNIKQKKIIKKETFASIKLAKFLRDKQFSTIYFTGIATDICVINNIALTMAFCPEASIQLISDMCIGLGDDSYRHNQAISVMSGWGVGIISMSDFLESQKTFHD